MRGSGVLDKQWEISARDPQAPPWQEIKDPEWEAARMPFYAAQIESMDRAVLY